jgi:hypothetical protein
MRHRAYYNDNDPSIQGRVGLLRGYGNAINPQLAAELILSAMEAIAEVDKR